MFIHQALMSSREDVKPDQRSQAQYEYIKLSLGVVNCFLGDLIILSIVFKMLQKGKECTPFNLLAHLGPARTSLYAILCFLLMDSLAAGIGMLCTCMGLDVLSGGVTSPGLRGWPGAWLSLVLATNLMSTFIFAYEFVLRWKQRKRENITVFGGPLEQFFVALMCTGAIYCCTLTVMLVLFIINSNVRYVFSHMIPQFAGIYPTATIVIVAFSTNDPSIQPSSTRAPTRHRSRRFDDLPPPSLRRVKRIPPLPSPDTRGNQRVASPDLVTLPVSSVSPQRVVNWCRSKLLRPSTTDYPRRGSETSIQNSIHVHIQTIQQVDELYPPKRTTSPSFLPLDTTLDTNDALHWAAEPFKRRSIKWAGQEEDEISPSVRYRWLDDGGNPSRASREQDDGRDLEFYQWWTDNTSSTITALLPYHREGGAETV
ncbi:hypothetical protein PENSPDRAFT_689757 [Peniophora sp. CONT]|nr:hypothetical protein PENSPDRAFT_689757 [Peniophora sp. CONT]